MTETVEFGSSVREDETERREIQLQSGDREIRARGGPSKMISSRAQARLSAGLITGVVRAVSPSTISVVALMLVQRSARNRNSAPGSS